MTSINDFTADEICSVINELSNRGCVVTNDKTITYLTEGENVPDEQILTKLIENKNNKPMNELRKLRNSKLQASDKYVLIDYPISDENKNIIINYRNQLRNLPSTLQNQIIDINNLFQYLPNEPSFE